MTLQQSRSGWTSALLHAEIDGQDVAVGAVVLGGGRPAGTLPPASMRHALGQRLYEEGDVSLGEG